MRGRAGTPRVFVRRESTRDGRRRNPSGAARLELDDPAEHMRTLLHGRKACLLHEPTRISVQPAAARDRRPGRGGPALQAAAPAATAGARARASGGGRRGRAHGAARREPPRIGDRAEAEARHGAVEARRRERQVLGEALDDGDRRRRAPRRDGRAAPCPTSGSSAIDRDAGVVPAQLAAGPGAHLEHAAAGVRRQAAPPGAQRGALERPHERVVDSGVAARAGLCSRVCHRRDWRRRRVPRFMPRRRTPHTTRQEPWPGLLDFTKYDKDAQGVAVGPELDARAAAARQPLPRLEHHPRRSFSRAPSPRSSRSRSSRRPVYVVWGLVMLTGWAMSYVYGVFVTLQGAALGLARALRDPLHVRPGGGWPTHGYAARRSSATSSATGTQPQAAGEARRSGRR